MKVLLVLLFGMIAVVSSQNLGSQMQAIGGFPQRPGMNSQQSLLQGRPPFSGLQGMINGMRPGNGMIGQAINGLGQRPGMNTANLPGMTGTTGSGLSGLSQIINILPQNIQNLPPVRLFLSALRAYVGMMTGNQSGSSSPLSVVSSMGSQLSSLLPGTSNRPRQTITELNDEVIQARG